MKLDRHPDALILLAWTEGELSALRGWMVARHVRSCWECRLKCKQWEDAAAEVAAGVNSLPEPTRLETAKALWRFRVACQDVEVVEPRRLWRLPAAWVTPALSVLAVAGVAVVAIQSPISREAKKQPQFAMPAQPRTVVPSPYLEPAPRLAQPPANVLRIPVSSSPVAEIAVPASEEDLVAAEVHALYELHRARLCRLEVHRVGSFVEVKGIMVSAPQRLRLAALFADPAYGGLIRLHFEEAEVPAPQIRPLTAGQTGSTGVPPLEERLRERYKGLATQRDIFNLMGELATEAETVSEHAWTLRRLAERFPVSRARTLPPALQDLILRMAADHSAIVAGASEKLWKRMAPEAGPAGVAFQASDPGGRNQTWQDRALALQELAEAAATGLLSGLSPMTAAAPAPRERFEYCADAAKGLHASLQTQLALTH